MNGDDRLVTSKRAEEDAAELALRPQTLDDFIGQKQLRENLKIYIAAAKSRKEALDHVLFHGPPGPRRSSGRAGNPPWPDRGPPRSTG